MIVIRAAVDRYVEKSNTLLEERNEGYKLTANQSQSRILALEQEKVRLCLQTVVCAWCFSVSMETFVRGVRCFRLLHSNFQSCCLKPLFNIQSL